MAQLKSQHEDFAAQLRIEHEEQITKLHALTESKGGAEKVALEQLEQAQKERDALEARVQKLEGTRSERALEEQVSSYMSNCTPNDCSYVHGYLHKSYSSRYFGAGANVGARFRVKIVLFV